MDFCRIDINRTTGNENDDVMRILNCTNKNINKMIIAYIKAHRSSKYALIKAQEKMFYDELEKIQEGNPSSRINIKTLQKELEESQIDFLSGDNNISLLSDFEELINYENIEKFRPEGIAESLSEGVMPVTEEEIAD